MSMERIMLLSLVVVGLLILGMAGIVVLLRNLHIFKSAKTDSTVEKSKESN